MYGEAPKPKGYKRMEAAEKKMEMKAKEEWMRKIIRSEIKAVMSGKKPAKKATKRGMK